MTFKTADLCDANESNLQIVAPGLFNFGGQTRFHGQMVTISTDGDNSRVREQLQIPGQGKVLVVDNQGSLDCAMLGDRMATALIEQGWQGVVINGCIRDSDDIASMAIAVKALATNPLRSVKQNRGELNVAVEFLGAVFRPGEFLYSDEDGILLSPQALL